jgi:hypothetical protein
MCIFLLKSRLKDDFKNKSSLYFNKYSFNTLKLPICSIVFSSCSFHNLIIHITLFFKNHIKKTLTTKKAPHLVKHYTLFINTTIKITYYLITISMSSMTTPRNKRKINIIKSNLFIIKIIYFISHTFYTSFTN